MKCNVAEFIGTIQDGGAETLIKDYVLMLDKNKFNPIVILLRKRNTNTANYKILEEKNAKIIPIYKSDFIVLRIIQKMNSWWYIPFMLKKIIQQESINVLHVHLTHLRYVARISKSITHLRLFYTCHNEPARMLDGKRMNENKAAKYLIKNNDLQMIALHESMKNEINAMFNIDNTVVIKNGIDFNKFHNISESKEKIRNSFGIPDNSFVIGHIGRFASQKNHSFLVDVFIELCNREKNAFLLLVGAGELCDQIKNKLNSAGLQGKYLILSNRSDIPQIMRAMDVFVFPSLFEGLPVVLIEAQVSGLRCVVSDKVTNGAFITELAIPVNLNEPVEKWCDIILNTSIKGTCNGNIEDYDMNKEIKRLENLYLGKVVI